MNKILTNELVFNITGNENLDMILFILILIWVLAWKGKALWIAAKKDSIKWFVALLVFQTMGILDILYIFFFSKDRESSDTINDGENLASDTSVSEPQ
ncbi:MAG TPA: DUF5652 family protein [Candidatus Paceibacterota bacterium]|nr:DUF5652 family protein [Candidatus Paceibacterota bacterium]HRZ34346.1 DUF5652 family protein [Candidatus Paceibacterota bacterium]